MAISFMPDQSDVPDDSGGVDAQFYQRQVPPGGPFNDNSFAMATARAKDKARMKLVHAAQAAQDSHAADEWIPAEVTDVASGNRVTGPELTKAVIEVFLSTIMFL